MGRYFTNMFTVKTHIKGLSIIRLSKHIIVCFAHITYYSDHNQFTLYLEK
jgi:hypothetical protein